jgi:hypothetical protein
VWPRQKDAREENTKINYGMDTAGEKEERTSERNVDRRSTSSHDNKKFGTRSMEKQRGMAFGFRKTATAVIKLDGWMDGLDRCMHGLGEWMDRWMDGWIRWMNRWIGWMYWIRWMDRCIGWIRWMDG